MNQITEILIYPDSTDNRIFHYLQPDVIAIDASDARRTYHYYFDVSYTDSSFTLVYRMRGSSLDTIDTLFFMNYPLGS